MNFNYPFFLIFLKVCSDLIFFLNKTKKKIFPSLLFWAISVSKLQCPAVVLCVCVSIPTRKTRLPVDYKLLVKDSIAIIGIPLDILGFCCFSNFLGKQKCFFWLLQTILLCQTCTNTRNTSIPPRVLSFKVVFVSKFNLMEDRFLLLFGPLSEGLDLIFIRYM